MHPAAAHLASAAITPHGRRRLLLLSAITITGIVTALLAVWSLLPGAAAATSLSGVACPVSGVAVGDGDGDTGLDAKQIKSSQAIISTGQQLQIPLRGQVVAIATALQESQLRNIKHGDRDSLGLFQQRPSQGWGTAEQITDPVYSSKKFYSRLLKVPGWQKMPVTDAAQAVQRSAFPTAYAKHERRAVQIVASIGQGQGDPGAAQQVNTAGCEEQSDAPTGAADTALGQMVSQVGKPYKWGATGPDSFDCSGLIVYGWRKAGQQLSVRTSQQMHEVSTPVKSGQEKPGDLIFSAFKADGPAHVLIVVKPGIAVEAPRTGLDVRVREYDAKAENMKFGRLPQSALKTMT